MDWNPELYKRFSDERKRPFLDLLDLLPPKLGGSVLDLGCGDGRLTRLAAHRLGAHEVLGVDKSAAMIDAAHAEDDDGSDIDYHWSLGDMEEVLSAREQFDLVLSNASLQFVGDHGELFPRMLEKVAPGGWIAIHVPYNHVARTHLLMDAAAHSDEFEHDFTNFHHAWPQEEPDFYARTLQERGFEFAIVQLRTYRHAVEGVEPIVEWMRGAAMRPFLEALENNRREPFLRKYSRLVDYAYPAVDDDDTRLLDYTRLLIVGRRPATMEAVVEED